MALVALDPLRGGGFVEGASNLGRDSSRADRYGAGDEGTPAIAGVRGDVGRESETTVRSGDAANGASYPNTTLGRNCKMIAQMMKIGIGLRVATLDFGGWDTHNGQDWREKSCTTAPTSA